MKYAHIIGWGRYIPNRVMTNDQMAELVDTTDEWIFTRTGIRQRHIAGEQDTTATLAFEAAARALAVANVSPSQVDLIIVATSTAEYAFPSTATQVQSYLGASNAAAFDLSAACTGFVYAVHMAWQAIATGSVKNVVVIGAEMMSRVMDWEDRQTCILFGDGAGAVVMQGSSVPGGVIASALHADGSGGNVLSLPNVYKNHAAIMSPTYELNGAEKNVVDMHGRQVFRFATSVVPDSIREVVAKANLTVKDVDLVIPHQANWRILESAAKKLNIPEEKFYSNVHRVGNTSAASIPIALCEAIDEGRVKPNDKVIFTGFGGGLTWGSTLVRWGSKAPDELKLLEREWKRTRYVMARGRAKLRQWGRQIAAYFAPSPNPDARLKDAEKDKDKKKGVD